MPDKCILIVLDGLGDRSFEELGHRTPLQAARTPSLDRVAALGANGLYHAASLGMALPSENAHFAMFGYDLSDFPGRGTLEALGADIPLGPKDVAVLAHFVSVRPEGKTLMLEAIRPKATEEEASTLFREIAAYRSGKVDLRLHRTHGLDGVVTLHGNVSPYITDSDTMQTGRPLIALQPWKNCSEDACARNTARALRAYLQWVYRKLRDHPINRSRMGRKEPSLNAIVTQRAGRLRRIVPFEEQIGLRGVSIADGLIYHGLASYMGLDTIRVKDTGDPGADLAQRLELARDSLGGYSFVHVHTKSPDEAAHAKNPRYKKEVIESLDAGLGKVLPRLLEDPQCLLAVTSDHSSPSSGPLIHSGEPVPVAFCGQGVRRDAVHHFDEVSAAAGSLGCVRGKELMYLVLNHLDRAKLVGIMDTPVDQAFWPGTREPFQRR